MQTLHLAIENIPMNGGNPLPKLKMTGKQHWTDRAQNYVAWKQWVVVKFLESLEKDPDLQRQCEANCLRYGHPIALGADEHARLFCGFEWKNGKHGDPENCLGAIADALFLNDKNVDVETMSRQGDGCVSVEINIFENEAAKLSFFQRIHAIN